MTDHNPTGQAFQQFEYLTLPLGVSGEFQNRVLRAALDAKLAEDAREERP